MTHCVPQSEKKTLVRRNKLFAFRENRGGRKFKKRKKRRGMREKKRTKEKVEKDEEPELLALSNSRAPVSGTPDEQILSCLK